MYSVHHRWGKTIPPPPHLHPHAHTHPDLFRMGKNRIIKATEKGPNQEGGTDKDTNREVHKECFTERERKMGRGAEGRGQGVEEGWKGWEGQRKLKYM